MTDDGEQIRIPLGVTEYRAKSGVSTWFLKRPPRKSHLAKRREKVAANVELVITNSWVAHSNAHVFRYADGVATSLDPIFGCSVVKLRRNGI